MFSRHRTSRVDERPLGAVPVWLWLSLSLVFAAQISFRLHQPPPGASARALPVPPPPSLLHAAALGERLALARVLNLWLQASDYQPGISIPYARLDYVRVRGWLDRIVEMDPAGQYPFLAATRLYGAIRQPDKQRLMLEWVYARYPENPARRWRWLAHAALVAKYQLDDLALALRFAKRLTLTDRAVQLPFWARDLSVLILEDQCELDAAKILIGGLLAEGDLEDAAERRFLERKLERMDPAACKPISGRGRMRGLGLNPYTPPSR